MLFIDPLLELKTRDFQSTNTYAHLENPDMTIEVYQEVMGCGNAIQEINYLLDGKPHSWQDRPATRRQTIETKPDGTINRFRIQERIVSWSQHGKICREGFKPIMISRGRRRRFSHERSADYDIFTVRFYWPQFDIEYCVDKNTSEKPGWRLINKFCSDRDEQLEVWMLAQGLEVPDMIKPENIMAAKLAIPGWDHPEEYLDEIA